MTTTRTIDPRYFQSRTPDFCSFFAICPAGTTVAEIFQAPFWEKVAGTAATSERIVVDSLIRFRAHDNSYDFMASVVGFRANPRTPILQRWPKVPVQPQTAIAPTGVHKTRAQALAVLELHEGADDELIARTGRALQASSHPDRCKDETDRLLREARTKAINGALDLLLKRSKAA